MEKVYYTNERNDCSAMRLSFLDMSDRNIYDPLEKVRKLERRHVEVHLQLLKALDELYLTKEDRQNFMLAREQEAQLEDRHMLQMSLEKSVAISKAIKRHLQQSRSKSNQNDISADTTITTRNDDVHDVDIGATDNNNIIISTTSEDKLASELIRLSMNNFSLDSKLVEMLEPLHQLSQEYNERRQEFERLKSELNQLVSNLPLEGTKNEAVTETNNNTADSLIPASPSSADVDLQLERENTSLIELITALTHLSRR